MIKLELTREELLLIIKGLTTGQFHIVQHDDVYKLATKLRLLTQT